MYCKSCGKQIPLGQTECKFCNGQGVASAPRQTAQPNPAQQNQIPQQPVQPGPQAGPGYQQPRPGSYGGQVDPGYQQPRPGSYGGVGPGPNPGMPGPNMAMPVAQQNNSLATAALITGIVSFILPIALVPIILGIIALYQIKASNGRQGGNGLAIAGIVIGGVNIFLVFVLYAILFPVFMKAREKARQQYQMQPNQFQQNPFQPQGSGMLQKDGDFKYSITNSWKEAIS